MKRRHVTFTLEEKNTVITEVENGMSYSIIATKCNIGKSTVYGIYASKDEIKDKIIDGGTIIKKRRTLKAFTFEKTEKSLFLWFLQKRSLHLPVSNELLKSQAKKFHSSLESSQSSFTPSDGWCTRFKRRYRIRLLTISGEKLSADDSTVLSFKDKLKDLISEMNLSANQIYNADESALFWKQYQTKTLVSSNEKNAPGRKIMKARIIFMPCSNATGTHKLSMMVLGSSKNPRPFKNIQLPVSYYSSRKGWMTREIFAKWFYEEFIPSVRKFSSDNDLIPSAVL